MPQSEVIRAISLEDGPCCGVPHLQHRLLLIHRPSRLLHNHLQPAKFCPQRILTRPGSLLRLLRSRLGLGQGLLQLLPLFHQSCLLGFELFCVLLQLLHVALCRA